MQQNTENNHWDSLKIKTALQREFANRCKRNPAYSLRAYAQFLGIDQSFLSKILRGQRRITPALAQTIGTKLGVKAQKITEPLKLSPSFADFTIISDDEFDVLSSWHHFAILELAKTKKFDPEPSKIAQRLGLHVEEVRDAIDRLERLKFIQVKGKKWKLLSPNNTWSNLNNTTEARRQLQKNLLQKSLDAIDHVPYTARENGSLTVAIDKSRLPEFKEKLKKIRAELCEYFQPESGRDLNEVYQLTLAFFPISKIKQENENE